MTATVRTLAELVQGQFHGNGEQLISEARSLHEAQTGHITFVESEKQARQLTSCQASAIVVPQTFPVNGRTIISVRDPLSAFIAILQHLRTPVAPEEEGVHPLAFVHPSAILGPGVSLAPYAHVGAGSVLGARCRLHAGAVVGRNCTLGDEVTLHPHVVVYDDCILGDRVTIHAGTILGADGFGYRQQNGQHVKVPQLGRVEIGDDVEIGANATVDRGTFQSTRIGAGTKIDNLVQVAHNCQIGVHNLLVSQVGIAGSSSTGAYVVMAGQVGVTDHVHIGDGAVLGARTGVTSDLAGEERYLGAPALPEKEMKKILVHLTKLPEMRRDLLRMKSHLGLTD